MAVRNLANPGRRAALVLAVAAIALPAVAFADPDGQNRGGSGHRNGDRGDSGGGRQGGNGGQARGGNGGQQQSWGNRPAPQQQGGGQPHGWARPGAGWQGQAPVTNQAPAPQPAPRWSGNQNGRNGSRDGDRGRNGWSGDQRRVDNGSPAWARPDNNRDHRDTNWRDGDRARGNEQWRNNNQNRYNDQWRNQQWRNQRWGNSNTWSNNRYRDRDYRDWDRHWRNNDRYNWSSYRRYNPSIYRWGTYYAPYRGYSYHRLSIGIFLDSLFYGSSYWINDPWQYRLPDAYGPYRWVRYYDDALLVDTYSGEVVDVIYGFFW
ncbi:MAG: RcnB family protein [Sphingomonadales bacterium]|nr:RcnB family protein [Sphingomonadales bacterium]